MTAISWSGSSPYNKPTTAARHLRMRGSLCAASPPPPPPPPSAPPPSASAPPPAPTWPWTANQSTATALTPTRRKMVVISTPATVSLCSPRDARHRPPQWAQQPATAVAAALRLLSAALRREWIRCWILPGTRTWKAC